MSILSPFVEGLGSAILIILAAWLAAVWAYFCPRRKRQIGLAIALEQKAKEWMQGWVVKIQKLR